MSQPILKLDGLEFADLFRAQGLEQLDAQFLARLRATDAGLHDSLIAYRRREREFTDQEVSALILGAAPLLEVFIAELFGIEQELEDSTRRTLAHDPVFAFKKEFVQRRARKRQLKKDGLAPFAELDAWLAQALARAGLTGPDRELAVARLAGQWLADPAVNAEAVERLTAWCVRALTSPEGRAAVAGWVSFHLPHPTDYAHLVPLVPVPDDTLGRRQGPPEHRRQRYGFKLTDLRMSQREALAEVNYCIYCHDHDGDFCSKGFPEKKGDPAQGLKRNPLGVTLTGCPLDEKISEMHWLKGQGRTIAALAAITIDNPMCALTGHRICNDCMKGCIYQKQDPVNIPQTETRILTDVLELPWGVEIYDLLIRWNPLRPRQWAPKPYSGQKVLIAGMGPAGITMAHHMLMEGYAVVGTEGLKIEPLPRELLARPIRDYRELIEDLDARVMTGFGGVAEYGITVRWDKNFLKLIYLSLMRRPHFQVFGGVRFGGTLTVDEAWELGFDHLVIAVGAGLPKELHMPGSLAPGMRQANDFLMALQLTGAAKSASLTNLQIRLPAVVIGGGLTGVDTATEIQAYYIKQIEKVLHRYEVLAGAHGEAHVRERLDEPSRLILDEYLAHGREARAERERAKAEGREPDYIGLIHKWGGVTVAYRRTMEESPAYTRNHEELVKALEEGIYYLDGLEPKEARVDRYGHVEALVCRRRTKGEDGHWHGADEDVVLPARAILVATGAKPNIAYEFEHRGTFQRDEKGLFYQPNECEEGKLSAVHVAEHCKVPAFGPFTSYQNAARRVSFIGDTHPVFHGSVVSAIASAGRTYPKIVESCGRPAEHAADPSDYPAFRRRMEDLLQARVEQVIRRSPSMVELRVRAPMAARRFQPGQFFRLQNFETYAARVEGTTLQTEALAMTGGRVDRDAGTVSLLIQEVGASSRICATLKPGEPVLLMGPTGVRARIPEGGETVLVVGSRRGVAHILGTGPALRAHGNRVLFVAVFPSREELFCQDELEAAADAILWVTAQGQPIAPRRPQDRAATGDVGEILRRYAEGGLAGGAPPIPLAEVHHMHFIGGAGLVRRLRDVRYKEMTDVFARNPTTVASISGPMQCMLKGVCSQCLQWQIDPKTGRRTKAVFACSWQDQPLEIVDLDSLDERLAQNRLQEGLTDLWLDYLFERNRVPRV